LAAVYDWWRQNTTIRDLGPAVLSLVPDTENYATWEDDDGQSFPALDNELEAAKAAGDNLVKTEVLLSVGIPGYCIGNAIMMELLWARPIVIL